MHAYLASGLLGCSEVRARYLHEPDKWYRTIWSRPGRQEIDMGSTQPMVISMSVGSLSLEVPARKDISSDIKHPKAAIKMVQCCTFKIFVPFGLSLLVPEVVSEAGSMYLAVIRIISTEWQGPPPLSYRPLSVSTPEPRSQTYSPYS